MAKLPDSARELIESGVLAHLVTLNRDGSPQVSCVWVGVDGDELGFEVVGRDPLSVLAAMAHSRPGPVAAVAGVETPFFSFNSASS